MKQMSEKWGKALRGLCSAMLLLVLTLCCATQLAAQQRTITGVVRDANGPVTGASVTVKGTTTGVTTDAQGRYTISAAPGATLNFNFIGYSPIEVIIGQQTVINVEMEEDAEAIDEVVVIGYGTVRKRDLTGSVTSLREDVILAVPSTNVMQAVQGRIPGLDISGTGSDMKMVMRGHRSLGNREISRQEGTGGTNDPLIVIDGIIGGNIGDINPADVASIDVLKDASSTAIYGSMGANGVIIITTKSPEKGKMSVTVNSYAGWNMWKDENPRRMGESWITPRRTAAKNAGMWVSETDDPALFSSPAAYAAFQNNDWTDYRELISRKPLFVNNSVSFSGGTETTNARFTVGWEESQNNRRGGTADNFSLRTIVNQKINEWLSGGVNLRLAHDYSKTSPYTTDGSWELGHPYDEDGKLVLYPVGEEGGGYRNPLWNQYPNYKVEQAYATRISATGFIDVTPLKGLTFRSQFNANLGFGTKGSYVDANSVEQIDQTEQSTATYEIKPTRSLEWNNIITYQKDLGEHSLTATLFSAWTKAMDEEMKGEAFNQLINSNLWYALTSGNTQRVSSKYGQDQMFSYAGRLNYSYKGRYLFTASFRRDGSSLLSKGHKWDNFPSAALAWRISEEAFMKDLHWLDNLKLRLSYGVSGNSGIPRYGTQSGVTSSRSGLGLHDYALLHYDYVRQIGNTETGWEKSTSFNLGIDFSVLRGRLDGTVELYNTNTNDLLLARQLPTSAGADGLFTIYQNIGKTNNKGVEVALNAYPVRNKDFSWRTTVTFSKNNEKIVDLIDGNDIALTTDIEYETLMIGRPINSYRTYAYQGIWTEAERSEAATYFKDEAKTSPFLPGDYKILDRNSDNVINIAGDYDYVGSATPDWFAGFDNNFRYKNLDLSIYVFFRWGQWGSNPGANIDPATGGGSTLYDKWFYAKGTNENGAKLPPLDAGMKAFDYIGYQSVWYCDRSFFKIKNISLGYTLPQSVASKMAMKNCRVYVSAANPWYYAKSEWMEGIDPEGSLRNYILGIQLTF
ncbi:MAG: SusC/RagA family TonB-linked outer membrane protein [Rikenellaceae bacterium]|jgi:TonB-linked SusC/RagA family outer membrane protein|nr:SusC/RagA family TonB-linked outer membrane protein [Rikenellaceae bacterium]